MKEFYAEAFDGWLRQAVAEGHLTEAEARAWSQPTDIRQVPIHYADDDLEVHDLNWTGIVTGGGSVITGIIEHSPPQPVKDIMDVIADAVSQTKPTTSRLGGYIIKEEFTAHDLFRLDMGDTNVLRPGVWMRTKEDFDVLVAAVPNRLKGYSPDTPNSTYGVTFCGLDLFFADPDQWEILCAEAQG